MYVEKEPQSPHPLAPTNGYGRSNDTEATAGASHDAREQRKKKRTKCFIYILLFVIFQTGVITLFSLTVMKVKTPKFRIRDATLQSTGIATPPAAPRLQANLDAEFSVKNTNFGRYKYRNTTVEFFYKGAKIGDVAVPNSRAGWRSTKKVKFPVISLDINNNPQLAGDLSAGVVPITSTATMRGRVELMFIMKKNRATSMNCTMDILTAMPQSITNIVCK